MSLRLAQKYIYGQSPVLSFARIHPGMPVVDRIGLENIVIATIFEAEQAFKWLERFVGLGDDSWAFSGVSS